MIGKLTGIVDELSEDHVVIDVGGVGYVVHCSAHTLARLPRLGERISLAIETQMREDALRLFGFSTAADRDWFRLLQTVQGVGAKVALGLLGALPSRDLAVAIAQQDRTAVARAPGIGPKLAARIVAELKDKVGALQPGEMTGPGPADGAGPGVTGDAVSALVNLGYGRPQALAAVAAARQELGEGAEASALIRRGLRELSR